MFTTGKTMLGFNWRKMESDAKIIIAFEKRTKCYVLSVTTLTSSMLEKQRIRKNLSVCVLGGLLERLHAQLCLLSIFCLHLLKMF